MGRIGSRLPTTTFGRWLLKEIQDRGWERKQLALISGVSSTHVNQIIAGDRSPSREVIEKFAYAFTSDADVARSLHNAGLKAAGFATAIEREPFLEQIIEAGVIEDLPKETQEEILDFMRFKAEQARRKREQE